MKKFPMLHALMAVYNLNANDLKDVIDCKHRSSITQRLNGNVDFKSKEMVKIANYFDELDEEETWTVEKVFFSRPVAKRTQNIS